MLCQSLSFCFPYLFPFLFKLCNLKTFLKKLTNLHIFSNILYNTLYKIFNSFFIIFLKRFIILLKNFLNTQINLINSLSKYFPIVKCVIKNDNDIPKTINTRTLPFKNASANKYVAIEETIINNKSININNTFLILNKIQINFRIS